MLIYGCSDFIKRIAEDPDEEYWDRVTDEKRERDTRYLRHRLGRRRGGGPGHA